jgi:hypothetical protein
VQSIALIDDIRKLAQEDRIIVSKHANRRIVERGISADDLANLILNGDIIEEYLDDFPCPSALLCGFLPWACHIVVGICKDQLRVITVYLPDEDEWIDNKVRK